MNLSKIIQRNTPYQPKVIDDLRFQNSKWRPFQIFDAEFHKNGLQTHIYKCYKQLVFVY